MQFWSLPSGETTKSGAAPPAGGWTDDLLVGLIGCLGRRDFGRHALARINRVLPAASWSVYRLPASGRPAMLTSASFGVPDTTRDCWRAYRAGLYRRDDTFASAREQALPGRLMMTQWHAEEIRPPHRDLIYRRHGVRERLSVVRVEADDTLLALNFYRHEHQRLFAEREIARLQGLAAGLVACVQRHTEIVETAARGEAVTQATDATAVLRNRCPALTGRELEVCDRLLRGWTYEGIAVDLGLSATTIKTYRNRAFERLGIHFRNELFALAFGEGKNYGSVK
jgi:DNA-binding CsgD family transcriptional regulator